MGLKILGAAVLVALVAFGVYWVVENVTVKKGKRK